MDRCLPCLDDKVSDRRSSSMSSPTSSVWGGNDTQSLPHVSYDSCQLRKDLILLDNCSKSRFIAMIAIDLLLPKRENRLAAEKIECPLLRCRKQFDDNGLMMRHLMDCPHFSDGEFWCYECKQFEKFPTTSRGHCSWTRKSAGTKVKDLFRKYSRSKAHGPPRDMHSKQPFDREPDLLQYPPYDKEFCHMPEKISGVPATGQASRAESGLELARTPYVSSMEPIQSLASVSPPFPTNQYTPQAFMDIGTEAPAPIYTPGIEVWPICSPRDTPSFSYQRALRRPSELAGHDQYQLPTSSQSSESHSIGSGIYGASFTSPHAPIATASRFPTLDRLDVGASTTPMFDQVLTESPIDAAAELPPWSTVSPDQQSMAFPSSGWGMRHVEQGSHHSSMDVMFHGMTNGATSNTDHSAGDTVSGHAGHGNPGTANERFEVQCPPASLGAQFHYEVESGSRSQDELLVESRKGSGDSVVSSGHLGATHYPAAGLSSQPTRNADSTRGSSQPNPSPPSPTTQPRDFSCPYRDCDWEPHGNKKNFRNYLRRHKATHQGLEFPCDLCDAVYNRNDNLQVHRKKHAAGPEAVAVVKRRASEEDSQAPEPHSTKRHRRSAPLQGNGKPKTETKELG